MEQQKIYDYTDKIVECLQHKNAVKQVYELQKVVVEIWKDGEQSNYCKECGYSNSSCVCDD